MKKNISISILVLLFIALPLAMQHAWAEDAPKKTAQTDGTQTDSTLATLANNPTAPTPVIMESGDTVLNIYASYGPFSKEERALKTKRQIAKILALDSVYTDSITVTELPEGIKITYSGLTLSFIAPADTVAAQLTGLAMAQQQKQSITNLIKAHKKYGKRATVVSQIAIMLAAFAGFIIMLRLLLKLFDALPRLILERKNKILKGLRFGDYQLLSAEVETRLVVVTLKTLKYIVIILLIYVLLLVVFSLFPWTNNLYKALVAYVAEPINLVLQKVFNIIPALLFSGLILVVIHYILRFIKYLATEIENEVLKINGFYPEWGRPVYLLIKFFLYLIIGSFLLAYLAGFSLIALYFFLSLIAIFVLLGSVITARDIFAGIVLTFQRAYKRHDLIKTGKITGRVISRTLVATRLRSLTGEELIVRNSKIWEQGLINFKPETSTDVIQLQINLTIEVTADPNHLQKTVLRAADRTIGILKKPAAGLLQTGLGLDGSHFRLNAYANKSDTIPLIYSRLFKNVQEELNKEGIKLGVATNGSND